MRRIHHPPFPHKNPHVRNTVLAIAARGPEYQIPGFCGGARDVVA